jgi:hypothetical protein
MGEVVRLSGARSNPRDGLAGGVAQNRMVPLAGLEPATPSLRITGKIFPIDLPQFRVIHFSFYFKQIADTTFP